MITFLDPHFEGCSGLINTPISEGTEEAIKEDLCLALLISRQVFMAVAHKVSETSAKRIRSRIDHVVQSRAKTRHRPGSTRTLMKPRKMTVLLRAATLRSSPSPL